MRLLALSIALGLALVLECTSKDTPAIETPRWIADEGFTAIEGDFHMHTRFSDGVASPFDLVLLAERRGLQTIAVTEHNTTFPAKLARSFATLRRSPVIVVVGEELTSREAHMLALGLEDTIDPRLPIRDVAEQVHAQGGVLIAAHPVKRFWVGLEGSCEVLDGVERMHPLAFRERSTFGAWDEVKAFETMCSEVKPHAVLGNSDFHVGPDFGSPRTVLFVRERTEDGVIDAIRERRTVVRQPDGTWYGADAWTRRAEALELRERQPSRPLHEVAPGLAVIVLVGFGLLAKKAPAGSTPVT